MKPFIVIAYALVGFFLGWGIVAVSWSDEKKECITNSLGMKFNRVPKGSFWMGGGKGKPGDRQVEISYDFFMGVYEVTQGQWQLIMGNNPSYFSRGNNQIESDGISDSDLKDFPVDNISWQEANQFMQELNALEEKRGWFYRLPTEAEWEYACRGGANSKEECSFDFYFSQPTLQLTPRKANFRDGGNPEQWLKRTTKVGSYKPNRLGLYDMHGNVAEWCDDSFSPKSFRMVVRGGGFRDLEDRCRVGRRYGLDFGYKWGGCRVALIPDRGWGGRSKKDAPQIYLSFLAKNKADLCGDFTNKDLEKLIAQNPALGWLRVGFPGMDANSLKELAKLKELSYLQVENPFWGKEKGKFLTGGWKDLWRLRSLKIKDLEISNEAMKEIGTLEKLYKLELINCGITNSGIKYISQLEKIQILALTGAQINWEGLNWLAELKNLAVLRLDQTGITNEDLKHLPERLRYLDLRSTKVDDQGLKFLTEGKSLKKIIVSPGQMTKEGIQAAKKTNPKLEVFRFPPLEK